MSMNNFLKNHWFRLCISVVLLIVSLSCAYYLVVFLPEQASFQQEQIKAQQGQALELELKKQQEIEEQNDFKKQAELAKQQQAYADELARQQAANEAEQQAKIDKINLDNCLNEADQAFATGWASLCKKKADYKTAYNQKLDLNYSDCVSLGYLASDCRFYSNSKIDDTYDQDCNLDSMEIALFWSNSESEELYYDANKLKEKKTEDRNLCYQQFN